MSKSLDKMSNEIDMVDRKSNAELSTDLHNIILKYRNHGSLDYDEGIYLTLLVIQRRLDKSRVGELTPTHEALTKAFEQGTKKAIEAWDAFLKDPKNGQNNS